MKKTVSILALVLSGCASGSDYEVVSLLDYATSDELAEKGFTPKNINQINVESKNEQWGRGYSRYEGYHKYKINNFDILVNPNNSDELYIFKNNNLLLDINEGETVRLFKKDTKFPNRNDTAIFWQFTDEPSIFIANDKELYYDRNLNGPDIVYDKMWLSGDKTYLSVSDSIVQLPDRTINKAYIENKQCKALVAEYACCEDGNGKYSAYQFSYANGWVVLDKNSDATKDCNNEDLQNTRERLLKEFHSNYVIGDFKEALDTE